MSQRLTYEELAASNVEMGRGMMRLAREAVDKDAEIERLRSFLKTIRHLTSIEMLASLDAETCRTAVHREAEDALSDEQTVDHSSRWCIHSSPTLCKFPDCECEPRS